MQIRFIPNFLECQDYLDPTKESVWRISEVVKLECIYCETCSSNQGSIENIDNFYTNGEDQICDAYFWNMKNMWYAFIFLCQSEIIATTNNFKRESEGKWY